MTENTNPTLNIKDILSAVQIIDYAVAQGIIKSWEDFENVKVVRDRLHAFGEAATKTQDATDANNQENQEPVQETVQEPTELKKETVKKAKK
jgi:hypothetical protein